MNPLTAVVFDLAVPTCLVGLEVITEDFYAMKMINIFWAYHITWHHIPEDCTRNWHLTE
jgi:hypothetical protein